MRLKNSGPNIFVDSSNFLCLQNRHNFCMRQKNPGSNNYKIRKGSIIIEFSAAKDFLVFHR